MRKIIHCIKLTAVLFGAAALALVLLVMPKRLAFADGGEYAFFLGDSSKNCKIVTATEQTAPIIRLSLGELSGESASYPADFDWEEYLKEVNGEVLFCETLDDSVNYYCRADLPYSTTLYGQTVNLHICVKETGVRLGTPIIFGGY